MQQLCALLSHKHAGENSFQSLLSFLCLSLSLFLSLEQNARIMREAEHIEGVTTTITAECNEIETENVFLAV